MTHTHQDREEHCIMKNTGDEFYKKTKSTIFQCPMYTHAHTNNEEELPLKNNCLYNNYYEE